MIRLKLFPFWICTLLMGVLLTFNACEEDTPEPEIEEIEVLPNDVRFQLRGGSFGEQNIVFEKTEGSITKTGYDESTGTTRLYTLAPKTNSNQNDIIDIYLPFTPTSGKGQVELQSANRQSKLQDFNVYIGGTKQVSLTRITVEIDEYGDVGGRIKGKFFGSGFDESIGVDGVLINFGEFDMLRSF
ncbi:MAG: hypothetical protein ACPG49_09855 [Chitinophagales bacterium]